MCRYIENGIISRVGRRVRKLATILRHFYNSVLFAQTEGHKIILLVTSINIDYWPVSSRIKLKRDNGVWLSCVMQSKQKQVGLE